MSKVMNVPPGSILVHEKWKDTPLGQQLKMKTCNAIYSNELNSADFYAADKIPVLYIPAESYRTNVDIKQKLKAFCDECGRSGVVLANRTTETVQDFSLLQDSATFSFNLCVMPIADASEIPDILTDLSYTDSRNSHNQFKQAQTTEDLVLTQLSILMTIPGLGRKKSQDLLRAFGHFRGICNASVSELAGVTGQATAKTVHDFLHKPYVEKK